MHTLSKGGAVSGIGIWAGGLLLALAVGGALYAGAARTVNDDAEQRFDNLTHGAQHSLATRVKSYSDLLRGLEALFRTSDPLTRRQFHDYVGGLDIARQFPAIESVNYAVAVTQAQRAAFIEAVRQDRSLAPGGYPAFTIRPAGERPEYTVLTYLEPDSLLGERMGVDIGANPLVARALNQARDSGEISASGQVIMIKGPPAHVGLGMRLPVYRNGMPQGSVAERRAAYQGSVGIGFGVAQLVHSALERSALEPLHLTLYSAAEALPADGVLRITPQDRLLFNDDGDLAAAPPRPGSDAAYFDQVLPVAYQGGLWKAHFRVRKAELYSGFDRYFPWLALAVGMAGTLLIYGYIYTLYRSRRRAVAQRVLLDTVLDSVDAYVYMKDADLRYRYVNARTATILGRSAEQVIGRQDGELMVGDAAAAAQRTERQVFDSGAKFVGEERFVDAQGQVHHLWSVKVPLGLPGPVTGLIGLSTDVTELHRLKEQADAASQAKSDFLSNMSHEIRTPMNSIIGMAHLALKSVADVRQRDYLQKIYHSGQHLLGLINDILDFSKIEAGKLELEVLDFRLDTLLANIASQLGDAAAVKGLTLQFDIALDLPQRWRGDPLRLEQVLLNLVSNAIKFSDNASIFVRVRQSEERGSHSMLRFEVQDRGIGMNQEEVAQLFRSFHQADPSTTRKYGGSGLGLVISKQLAELMKGKVGVYSQPGLGSTFWFTARLEKSVPASDDSIAQVEPEVLGVIRGASILLVEDNVFSQQVGCELLEDAGATVCVAGNGREALELLSRQRYDCVLMDVQMPEMDGFEATRRIRADPLLSGLLVIAMTANAGSEDRARCLEAGMDEFVTKPIAPNLLFHLLAKWFRLRGGIGHGQLAARADGMAPVPRAAPERRDTAILDLATLALTFSNDSVKMRKYAQLFLDTARDGIAEMEQAMALQDLGRLADLGHRSKSSALAVGAHAFAALCQSIEGLRRDGGMEQARALLAALEPALAQVAEQISLEFAASDAP
ncbi:MULTISPECIES: CHASE domain-containing protein [unclassified Janthinobacterium]|uniref:CHASE domain-containing protein n=1 Tax=unclassified Janthinobacterium TaxID=2610881 RepID=UPI0008F4FD5E|nr:MULTISPECIES: CHASE domain-containing protein [unclassified Janthinobacterium]APA68954.1 hybrid sensor and regulator [Janthinobacterium sp. 1_2014MBL_MicDiv]MDN2710824.1 CHASE domain-containing protein [Janthinobacterium sp. SUN118]